MSKEPLPTLPNGEGLRNYNDKTVILFRKMKIINNYQLKKSPLLWRGKGEANRCLI
jgi:hypothetical protein